MPGDFQGWGPQGLIGLILEDTSMTKLDGLQGSNCWVKPQKPSGFYPLKKRHQYNSPKNKPQFATKL